MATVQRRLDISLPPGPLGLLSLQQSKDGLCLVAELDDNAPAHAHPLRVGDVILSMNGIRMKEVCGGASGAWATLFSELKTSTRHLVVLRSGDGGGGAIDVMTGMATTTSNDSKTTSWAARKTTDNDVSRKHSPPRDSMGHDPAKRPRMAPPRHDAEKTTYPSSARREGPSANNAPGLDKSSRRNVNERANVEIISLLDDESDVGDEDAPSDEDGAVALSDVVSTRTRDNSEKAMTIEDDKPEDDDVMEVSNSSASSQWMRASSTLSSSSSLVHRGNSKDDRDYVTDNSGQEDQAKLTIVDIKGVEEEEDVMEVSASAAPSQWMRASSSLSSSSVHRGNPKDDSGQDDQAELTIISTKGKNALVDFPHSRENCATYPFATSGVKTLHCSNCYCYVCDVPSSDCTAWTSHCEASHKDPRWRLERVRAKHQARKIPIPSVLTTQAVALSRHLLPASSESTSPSSSNRNADYSVRNLLEQITTVHPVEMQPPVGSGFVTPLRHYQKQSLAFMVDTERTASRGGWLCDEVGMGKSAVVFALVATNPAIQSTLVTEQLLEEMTKRFDSIEKEYEGVRLAKKQLSEDFYNATKGLDTKIKDDILRHSKLSRENNENWKKLDEKEKRSLAEAESVERIKLKTTVVFTSVSLMGQWEDEAKKHAPGLVVKTFHKSRKKSDVNSVSFLDIPSLSAIDVIISTSTFQWPSSITKYCEFHRVVQDESHLFEKMRAAKVENANDIRSPRRWGVTATPMTSSTRDIELQLSFIEGSCRGNPFLVPGSLSSAMSSFQYNRTEHTFNCAVDLLRTFMIRHTKSQQINGSEALCLPPSTSSTILLTMSRAEENAFNFINSSRATFLRHSSEGTQYFTAERAFQPQMSKICNSEEHSHLSETFNGCKRRYIPERLTKVVALRRDLTEQRRTDPTIRAVVFTQFLDVHDACVRSLQRDGFDVYEFTGTSSTTKKDDAIRNFQDTSSRRPAALVVTLRTGNVGITLTAASRVYLLEPCLDPSVEVQAAGRIHRLGQDKACHVVKFVFNNSYESNIIDIHKEILAGRISIEDGLVPPKAMEILAKGLRFRQL